MDLLTKITDAVAGQGNASVKHFIDAANTTTEYVYDGNGNMIEDKNKGITVEYNLLNLPTKVEWTDGSNNKIEWAYSADGNKLSKTVYTGGAFAKKNDYANGFVYESTPEYPQPQLDYLLSAKEE